jgi:hypothetical protein
MQRLWGRGLLGLMFLLACAPAVHAQFETASVVGTVRDQSGAVVPDAKVTLTNTATGVSVTRTTTGDGAYEFVTVKGGIYLVTVEKPGFSLALTDNVQVQVGARLRVDMQLAIGQLSEKVVVTGTSPLIETDSSQRGQVITGDQMRELALNGREYSALALLSTGVRQSALNKSNQGTPREGAFNVNGLRSTFNNFLIDGVDNNAYGTSNQGFSNQVMQPAPDAVSEFRVVTNNQSAEYGRAAGATVNVAYRSGANQFHGDAWEFFRDTKLNATTFFIPPDGQKPPLRRNQYGGVLGGPIVKNKAFYFFSYEGLRQNRIRGTVLTVPTAKERQGDFSDLLNVDAVNARKCLKDEGADGRIVTGIWCVVQAELAESFDTAASFSAESVSSVLKLTASGGMHGTQSITLEKGSVFSYRLSKVKDWDGDKVAEIEHDYSGLG